MLTEILLLLALQTVLFVWSWGLEENHRLTLVERDIYLSDLPDELEGLTILQVSDLHDCAYGKDGRELMALASTLPYDLWQSPGTCSTGIIQPDAKCSELCRLGSPAGAGIFL